jgi:hypothetical protein
MVAVPAERSRAAALDPQVEQPLAGQGLEAMLPGGAGRRRRKVRDRGTVAPGPRLGAAADPSGEHPQGVCI